jgi:nicotinate-nucleotide pyrophosphorylase (carboxylating)
MLNITPEIESVIEQALAEDVHLGDPTTSSTIPDDLAGTAILLSKSHGILAGLPVALGIFQRVDQSLQTEAWLEDGNHLEPGTRIAQIQGPLSAILMAERTALNFLQRLSGIASETARYVQAVSGLKVRIVDTRKTTPGLRTLEKYAVTIGGGKNHRHNLGDGILIKDNHIAALQRQGIPLEEVVRRARTHAPHSLRIEVEVESAAQATDALNSGAEIILLDNMGLEEMRTVVKLVKGRALTEASGGITLENVRAVGETGVDIISVGALTHSVKSLDISLDIE